MSSDGFVDVGGLGISYSDIVESSFTEVSSWVTDFGTEYLGFAPTELAPFGDAWQEVGSLAGDANWFDLNYPGEIVPAPPPGFLAVTGGEEGVTTNLVSRDFNYINTDIDPTGGGLFTDIGGGFYELTSDVQARAFDTFVSDFKEYFSAAQLSGAGSGSILDSAKSVLSSGYKVVTDFFGQLIPGPAIGTTDGLYRLTEAETRALFGGSPLINYYAPASVGGVDPNVLASLRLAAQFTGINPNIVTAAAVSANDPSALNLLNTAAQISGQDPRLITATAVAFNDPSVANLARLADVTGIAPRDANLVASGRDYNSTSDAAALLAAQRAEAQAFARGSTPAPVTQDPQSPNQGTPFDDDGNLNPGWTRDGFGEPVYIGDDFIDPDLRDSATQQRQQAEATNRLNATINARRQAEFQQQIKEANDGDWRVRLRLAPNANYLYKATNPGILDPLRKTDGILFPYTPQITTAYRANYSSYDLTHSNYRGYFYQGSYVDDIQINAMFTAQDSVEAEYLLAVIHFFRSATKMFYGQDAQAGAPPPLVYLQGHGTYQFGLAPCVIAQFNYNLPADVDYIRARSPNINGTNLLQRRDRTSVATDPFSSAVSRISNLLNPQGIRPGAQQYPPAAPTLGTNQPTYVPTKMEISLILHPIQSRQDVSKIFSLKNFANGNQLRGGFW